MLTAARPISGVASGGCEESRALVAAVTAVVSTVVAVVAAVAAAGTEDGDGGMCGA